MIDVRGNSEPTYYFYCDEAGNAGPNYGASVDPVHVLAGWLVPFSSALEFRMAATQLRSSSSDPEVKTNKLLKRERGQRRGLHTLESILKIGAIPFFLIAERRYALAVKINHTLFDAGHNPNTEFRLLLQDVEREVAMRTLKLPPRLLDRFADVYKTPDKDELARLIGDFRNAATAIGDSELAHWFKGAYDAIEEIFESDFCPAGAFKHYELASLNTPIYIQLIRSVDNFVGKFFGGAKYQVVHDETIQFERIFEFYNDCFCRLGERQGSGRNILVDQTGRRMNVDYMTGFCTQNSANSPEIQAADLLASSLFKLSRDVLAGREWSSTMTEIGRLTLPVIQTERPEIGGVFGSHDLMARLLLGTMGKFPPLN